MRTALVFAVPVLFAWQSAGLRPADNTPAQPAAKSGAGDRPTGAGSGLGLDVVQRRAINDPWVLSFNQTYRRVRDGSEAQRLRESTAQAVKLRQPGQVQVAIDGDQDGIADTWVWFADDAPAFVEKDLFGTGCRDWRADLRDKKGTASEFGSWSVEPPIPLPAGKPPLRARDLFDSAIPAEKGGRARVIEEYARGLLPNLADDVKQLARIEMNIALHKQLTDYVQRARKLRPRFQKIFDDENLGPNLRTPFGFRVDFRPYDPDGGEGKQLAVGFAPEGVVHIQFYQESWLKKEGMLADCFFERGEIVQVDLKAERFVKLEGHWVHVSPQARKAIARVYLAPGFQEYRAGDWYPAVAKWQDATKLAAVLGDLAAGAKEILDDEINYRIEDKWDFTVEGRRAYSLLQVAHGFGWRRGIDGIESLAHDSAQLQNYEDALALYSLGVRLAGKIERVAMQGNMLDEMAAIHKLRGQYDLAVQCLFQALDLESTLAHATEIVDNLGKLATDPNDPVSMRRAVAIRSHAMALNRACKLATIAALYADLGEPEKAENYLGEAERLAKSLGARYAEADILNLRAKWDLAAGRWELGVQRLERALRLAREQMTAQKEFEDDRDQRYRPGRALHTFRVPEKRTYLVVGMTAPTNPLSYQALSAGLLGEAFLQRALTGSNKKEDFLRQLGEAEKWQKQAVAWYEEAKDDMGQLVSRLRLAEIAYRRPNFDAALALAVEVEKKSQKVALFETLWRSRVLQASIHAAEGRTDAAMEQYEQAAREIESLRATLHSEPIRLGFFSSKLRVYEELALLHLAKGADEKVWECMERSRSRSLLDVVAGQELLVRGREVAQLGKEQPLMLQLVRTGTTISGKETTADFQKVHQSFLESLSERPLMQEVTSLRSVNPVKLKAVQEVLGPKTLLIEYFATERELLAALVSSRGVKVIKIANYDRAVLHTEVEQFRKSLQNPNSDYEPLARRLYKNLLAPCLAGQDGIDHLCIVPAASLHYLPFHALVDDAGKFVIEKRPVSYASSASALVFSYHRRKDAERKGPSRTLVVAEPQPAQQLGFLPYAALEGQRIHDLASRPRKLLEGKEATEEAVLAELRSAGCFHFAGHTRLLPNAPLRTALLCTPDVDHDGLLEVRELFGMNLRGCDLAVLSACETLLGRYHQGDEIVGLTRAFLRAGVPTIVASLWKVPDESTFRLMVRFHQLRLEGKLSKLEALTQAQREYLKDRLSKIELTAAEKESLEKRFKEQSVAFGRGLSLVGADEPVQKSGDRRHPFYWGAFQLQGDWR